MNCCQDHTSIGFDGPVCPLCEALSKLEAAEADRDYARAEVEDKQAELEHAYFDRYGR